MNLSRHAPPLVASELPMSDHHQEHSRSTFISPTIVDDSEWYNVPYSLYLRDTSGVNQTWTSLSKSLRSERGVGQKKTVLRICQIIVKEMIEEAFALSGE